ncbi:hypothetical protein Rhopal_007472-T1 [Rhodotorula paludigena]|uniref:Uncharacterized protein n=1 Tax=Rhodotorula paludigena TaxID=86838 RepID=A0AAV5GYF6_9BASI|nr:hypothetical protein Rhopal_007472-T1 [Rhodotorula paludigena]
MWTHSSTHRGPHSSAPSLALAASSRTASSLDSLPAAATLDLRLQVFADDHELDSDDLAASGLIREVTAWLDSLSEIDVVLRFRSTSTPLSSGSSKKTKRTPVAPSQSTSQALESAPPAITLATQLLSPAALHFTLAALHDAALTRLAKKLVVAFPLCFNPRWIDRITNDLPAQRSIAASLRNILGLSGGKGVGPETDGVDTSAALLGLYQIGAGEHLTQRAIMQTLTSHISTCFPPSPASTSPPASPPDPHMRPPPPPALSAKSALETALLLLSKHALAPDAWVAAAPNDSGAGAGAGSGTAGSGKKQPKRRGAGLQSGKGATGKGKGKKRRRAEEEVEEDEELVLEREDKRSRLDGSPSPFDEHLQDEASDEDSGPHRFAGFARPASTLANARSRISMLDEERNMVFNGRAEDGAAGGDEDDDGMLLLGL